MLIVSNFLIGYAFSCSCLLFSSTIFSTSNQTFFIIYRVTVFIHFTVAKNHFLLKTNDIDVSVHQEFILIFVSGNTCKVLMTLISKVNYFFFLEAPNDIFKLWLIVRLLSVMLQRLGRKKLSHWDWWTYSIFLRRYTGERIGDEARRELKVYNNSILQQLSAITYWSPVH